MPLPVIPFSNFEIEVVKQNQPLQVKAIDILIRAKSVKLLDNQSLKSANDLKLEINAQTKTVKDVRLEFTRPLDEFKKTILDAERDILVNLEEAKMVVAGEILEYEEKLESERRAEEQRVEGICSVLETDGQNLKTVDEVNRGIESLKALYTGLVEADQAHPTIKLAYMRAGNNLQARSETIVAEDKAKAERQRLAEEAKTQSAERAEIEAEKARIESERQKIDVERKQLARREEERKLAVAKFEAEKAAAKVDAEKTKTNTVLLYDFTVVDGAKVPAEYLSVDEQKIRAAIKAGARAIPGVEIVERKVVR